MPSFVVIVCLLLQSPAPASGQAVHAPHRFFDAVNISLTAMETGALLADGYTTQRNLHDFGQLGREADPLARPFVNAGWPGQIAGGALVVSADVGLRYWLHKRGHHKAERLLPLVLTTYGLVGAIHNAREHARFSRDYAIIIKIGEIPR